MANKRKSIAICESAAPEANMEAELEEYDAQVLLEKFWPSQLERIGKLSSQYFRDQHSSPELPLARIKKIMKLDDDVKQQMISGEVPILFSKAIEMFVEELTLRAWYFTEDNKRKTLQKPDVIMAVVNCDQFDFLIDVVPRDDLLRPQRRQQVSTTVNLTAQQSSDAHVVPNTTVLSVPVATVNRTGNDQEHQLATNHQAPTPATQTLQLQNGQVVQATPIGQPIQLITGPSGELQIVQQMSKPPQQDSSVKMKTSTASDDQMPQVFQQVVASDGTIQHVPIQLQLSPAQLQILKAQYASASAATTVCTDSWSPASKPSAPAPTTETRPTPTLIVRQPGQPPRLGGTTSRTPNLAPGVLTVRIANRDGKRLGASTSNTTGVRPN